MEVKAVSKYNRISARKARLVADMVRGQKVGVAFNVLRFTPRKAAKLIHRALQSAVSNAEHNFKLDKDKLMISKIMVDEGPTLKRFRPRAQGRASAIRKRTAHITVVVEGLDKESAKPSKKVSQVKKAVGKPKRKMAEGRTVVSKKVSRVREKEVKDGS